MEYRSPQLTKRESDPRQDLIVGEYKLSPSMTPQQLLDKILSGEVNYYQLTLAEGFSTRELPKLLADTTLVTPEQVQVAMADRQFMNELNIRGGTFEGYRFLKHTNLPNRLMPRRFSHGWSKKDGKRLTNEMLERTVQLGYDVHEINVGLNY